jgi:hypothetical protein
MQPSQMRQMMQTTKTDAAEANAHAVAANDQQQKPDAARSNRNSSSSSGCNNKTDAAKTNAANDATTKADQPSIKTQ